MLVFFIKVEEKTESSDVIETKQINLESKEKDEDLSVTDQTSEENSEKQSENPTKSAITQHTSPRQQHSNEYGSSPSSTSSSLNRGIYRVKCLNFMN